MLDCIRYYTNWRKEKSKSTEKISIIENKDSFRFN